MQVVQIVAGKLIPNPWNVNRMSAGMQKKLTAYIRRERLFDRWSDGLTGMGNPDTLVMVSDTTVTAIFQMIVTGVEEITPKIFALCQNFSNPFNPSTMITFDLPRAAYVRLSVYNVKGELVSTIVDQYMAMGRKEFIWTARDKRGKPVSSGVYFYRLVADDFVQTRKMLLLR